MMRGPTVQFRRIGASPRQDSPEEDHSGVGTTQANAGADSCGTLSSPRTMHKCVRWGHRCRSLIGDTTSAIASQNRAVGAGPFPAACTRATTARDPMSNGSWVPRRSADATSGSVNQVCPHRLSPPSLWFLRGKWKITSLPSVDIANVFAEHLAAWRIHSLFFAGCKGESRHAPKAFFAAHGS